MQNSFNQYIGLRIRLYVYTVQSTKLILVQLKKEMIYQCYQIFFFCIAPKIDKIFPFILIAPCKVNALNTLCFHFGINYFFIDFSLYSLPFLSLDKFAIAIVGRLIYRKSQLEYKQWQIQKWSKEIKSDKFL